MIISESTRNPVASASRGFTLVELLVALVIGIFIIGGAIAVFVANQTTYRVKTNLDDAQEAFRFASHSISRMVRMGDTLDGSNEEQLVVTFSGGVGVRDCLGNEVPDGVVVTNTFTLGSGELACDGIVLVRGVASLLFEFGGDGQSYAAPTVSETADPDYWSGINSVRALITMADSGIQSSFAASMRPMIIAMHGGGGTGSGAGNGTGNGDDGTGNGDDGTGNGDDGNGDDGTGNGDDDTGNGGTQMCVTEVYGTKHQQGTVEVTAPLPGFTCSSQTGQSYSCNVTTEMSVTQLTVRHVRPGSSELRNTAVNCGDRRQVNF